MLDQTYFYAIPHPYAVDDYVAPSDALARIVGDRPETPSDRRLLEADLDQLLGFARRIGIIEGFAKQGPDRVLIHIPAFSCPLSYREAIAFLTQSILEELDGERARHARTA